MDSFRNKHEQLDMGLLHLLEDTLARLKQEPALDTRRPEDPMTENLREAMLNVYDGTG